MKFTALCLLATATAALAAPWRNATRGCASHVTVEEARAAEARFSLDFAAAGLVDSVTSLSASIPVVWHVIYESTTVAGGYISDTAVANSISAMNSHYAGSGFSFYLSSTTRTSNPTWFTSVSSGNSYQTAMKNALHVGGANTLNVYTVGFVDSGLLGFATFPWSYGGNPVEDGVVVLFSSVPGGSTANYNQGKTLTHEVGHWLGLYHVFQGGCSESGDFVLDTPPPEYRYFRMPSRTGFLPRGRRRLGSQTDRSLQLVQTPVSPRHPFPTSPHCLLIFSGQNYMDYSYDPCLNSFTSGQIARATAQCVTYRGL